MNEQPSDPTQPTPTPPARKPRRQLTPEEKAKRAESVRIARAAKDAKVTNVQGKKRIRDQVMLVRGRKREPKIIAARAIPTRTGGVTIGG